MRKYFYIMFLLLSCNNAFSQKMLEGFTVMKLPRAEINIGAEWNNGIGTNGNGVPSDNLIISQSISSYDLDKSFKQNLELSIFNFLDLGAGYSNSIKISFNKLNIYSVKDFSKANVRSGQSILYEGIKADSIYIKINTDIANELKADITKKLKTVNINTNGDFNKGVTISGSGLFLAYRVFNLGKTKVKKYSKEIVTPEKGITEVKIKDYEFAFDNSDIRNCLFSNGNLDKNKIEECLSENVIKVFAKNYANVGINGENLNFTIKIKNNIQEKIRLFPIRKNGKMYSDNIVIAYLIHNQALAVMGILATDNEVSKVTLIRTETPFKILKNAKAPGW